MMYGLNLSRIVSSSVAGSCDHGDATCDSTKGGKCFETLSCCKLPKKDPSPCCYLFI
jgi:hypothetical protein